MKAEGFFMFGHPVTYTWSMQYLLYDVIFCDPYHFAHVGACSGGGAVLPGATPLCLAHDAGRLADRF